MTHQRRAGWRAVDGRGPAQRATVRHPGLRRGISSRHCAPGRADRANPGMAGIPASEAIRPVRDLCLLIERGRRFSRRYRT
jgi:hypothetical protein